MPAKITAGKTPFPAALQLVTRTRRPANKIRRLLRDLGDTDEHLSLGERFHRTSDRLESGPADAAADAKFADLCLAVHRLKLVAHEKFYTQSEARERGLD